MQCNRRLLKTLARFNGDFNVRSRLYYTNWRNKETLYSKISPLGNPSVSLTAELDGWVEKGNKVRFAELQRIIRDLRKRRRYSQALQVSEWMNDKGSFTLTPTEHAVHLNLIGKVHGHIHAESYFNNLKNQDHTSKTYGALLHCYVRELQTEKSLSHLKKMEEMGFDLSPLDYNAIMCLYTKIGQDEKIHGVLTKMKNHGVSPDNFSYRICINSYGKRSDIHGIERVLKEMNCQPDIVVDWNTYAVVANFYIKAGLKEEANDALRKAEQRLENKDGISFNHLITLHAQIGNKSDVLRLWANMKSVCKRCINRDYITMLQSLVKLDELEEAENVLKEWDSSGNCFDFRVVYTVVVGYVNRRLYEKAEAMLEEVMRRGKVLTANSWGRVGEGYFDEGEMEKSLKCMKTALCLRVEDKGWKPNPRVVNGLLDWLSKEGGVEDVRGFLRLVYGKMGDGIDHREEEETKKKQNKNGDVTIHC